MKERKIKCWAARNRSGSLELFKLKPVRSNYWKIFMQRRNSWNCYISEPNDVFPEITWENSPVRVEIKICDKRFVK